MRDDDSTDAAPRRSSSHIDFVRAGLIVACFLVAVGLLLGPASNLVGSSTTVPTTVKGGPPPRIVKSQVRVQVANGTTIQGLARSWTEPLGLLDWDVLPPVTSSTRPAQTVIYFAHGEQYAADVLARELNVPHTAVTVLTRHTGVPGASSDDVVIVIGHNHRGEGVKASSLP